MPEEIRALFEEVLSKYRDNAYCVIDERYAVADMPQAGMDLDEDIADYRQKLDALLKKLLAQSDSDCLEQLAGRYALD